MKIIPKKSVSKTNNIKISPIKSNYFSVTPKKSPVKSKIIEIPKISPTKSITKTTPIKSTQILLTPPKHKEPSTSPKENDLKKKTSHIIKESPKKKLDFNDDNKTIVETSTKRKISPINTPENKKFKTNSLPLSDTQVNIIIIIYLELL